MGTGGFLWALGKQNICLIREASMQLALIIYSFLAKERAFAGTR